MYLRVLAIFIFLAGSAISQEFKSVNVTYKLAGKDKSNIIYIPQYGDNVKLPVRGVMQNVGGPLKQFAHNNQVAMIKSLDQGRGFSKELLAAAAKAANRSEIEFAGAIVEGISKGGRAAADWAAENQERAIAVILDHSAIWSMSFPKRVKGVPMFFNATYDNMFQNIDRRKSHFQWCSAAFKAKQACTSIIDHNQKGGHGGRGSTDITAIWLDEAMAHRVPMNVPVGKPYKLVDVNPSTVGGYVSAKMSMDGKRSYHNNVSVKSSKGGDWWIPGPKSAALYLDWVKKNGGKVKTDDSASIKVGPLFLNPKGSLKTVASALTSGSFGKAMKTIISSKDIGPALKNTLLNYINSNVGPRLTELKKLGEVGDVYGLQQALKDERKGFTGIPEYDEKVVSSQVLLKTPEGAAELKIGKVFYFNITRMNKAKKITSFHLKPLKTMITQYPDSAYSKGAALVCKTIEANSETRMDAGDYMIKSR